MDLRYLFGFVFVECAARLLLYMQYALQSFLCLSCIYDTSMIFQEQKHQLDELLTVCFLCPLEGRTDCCVGEKC